MPVAEYKEAVRINPNEAQYRNNLGSVYERQGKVDAAMMWNTRKAVRINPKYDFARGNLIPAYAGSRGSWTRPSRSGKRPSVSTRRTPRPAPTWCRPMSGRGSWTTWRRCARRPSSSTPATPGARNKTGFGLRAAGEVGGGARR